MMDGPEGVAARIRAFLAVVHGDPLLKHRRELTPLRAEDVAMVQRWKASAAAELPPAARALWEPALEAMAEILGIILVSLEDPRDRDFVSHDLIVELSPHGRGPFPWFTGARMWYGHAPIREIAAVELHAQMGATDLDDLRDDIIELSHLWRAAVEEGRAQSSRAKRPRRNARMALADALVADTLARHPRLVAGKKSPVMRMMSKRTDWNAPGVIVDNVDLTSIASRWTGSISARMGGRELTASADQLSDAIDRVKNSRG